MVGFFIRSIVEAPAIVKAMLMLMQGQSLHKVMNVGKVMC